MLVKITLFFIFLIPLFPSSKTDIYRTLDTIIQDINKNISYADTKTYKDVDNSTSNTLVFTNTDLVPYNNLYEFIGTVTNFSFEKGHFHSEYINYRGIRHFFYNNKILVTLNGMRFVDAMTSSSRLDLIPIRMIKRLEIIKGATSALYGSNAYASLINITTYKSYDFQLSNIEIGIGSDSSLYRKLSYFAKDFYISINKNRYNYSVENTNFSFNPISNFKYSKEEESILAGYSKDRLSILYSRSSPSLYNTYTKLDNSSVSPIFLPLSKGEYTHGSSYFNEFLSGEYKIKDKRTFHIFKATTSKYTRFLDLGTLPYYNYDMKSISNEFEYLFKLASPNNLSIFGFNFKQDSFFHKTSTEELNNIIVNINPLVYLYQIRNNVVPFDSTYYLVPYTKAKTASYFLQNEFKYRKFNLTNSFRVDDSSVFRSATSRKESLLYNFNPSFYMGASHSLSFRFPHMGERFLRASWMNVVESTNIHEEKVDQSEIWFGGNFKKFKYRFAYFYMELYDIIYMTPVVGTSFIQPNNFQDYLLQGTEIDISYFISKDTVLKAGLFFNKTSESANVITDRAGFIKNGIKASLTKDYKKLKVLYGLDYVGKITDSKVDSAGFAVPSGEYYGGYTISKLNLAYAFNSEKTISLSIDNLFNKEYRYVDYLLADGHEMPLPNPRVFRLTLSYLF